ncbi:MAG: tyrosine--tRNA ligase [Chlamydiia bacterium]|nr:tyrosine--tRNA ligase [Chlamydiia bacterium]
MKNIIDVLSERGFIEQMTSPDLHEHLAKPRKVYIGFDPTADSLHLGNLMGIMALVWFQRFGHTPFALIGGATGRIGDPSGKSTERPVLDDKTLAANVASLAQFFHAIFPNGYGVRPVILNNNDWLGSVSLVDFLRDVGKHFRVGTMLAKESVRSRIQSDEGMSFTEFSYQVLQGYDFYYLNRHQGVTLQMGGSDQWGNITAGIELNRKLKGESLYGLTFPLLTRSDGKKFGKSEEGAIWLSAARLSPYHFYQHLFRVSDADVIRLLKVLTFLDLKDIQQIESSMQEAGYEPNTAQKKLAVEVTRFVHGEEGVQAALRVTTGMAPGSEAQLSAEILREISGDMPHAVLPFQEVVGQKFVDVALRVQLVPSKAEGVRLIKNGGAYLNNERISDPGSVVVKEHLIDNSYLLISSGKKKKILIKVIYQL